MASLKVPGLVAPGLLDVMAAFLGGTMKVVAVVVQAVMLQPRRPCRS